MFASALFLIAGLLFLYYGADWLVKGSSSLALQLGISPLVIGLTVVALGTSSPELAVNIKAMFTGKSGIAVGNIIGSNVANIGLILGISVIIFPFTVRRQLLTLDMPVLIASSGLAVAVIFDGLISRLEGAFLLSGLTMYLLYNFYNERKNHKEKASDIARISKIDKSKRKIALNIGLTGLGLGVLIAGGELFLKGAVEIAYFFEMSEAEVGLTIVAVGTSLPELATSVVASLKKQAEIAVGNIVGSNIFNVLGVLGCVSIFFPINAEFIKSIDIIALIGFAALLLPMAITDFKITRIEGFFLLSLYLAYIGYLLAV